MFPDYLSLSYDYVSTITSYNNFLWTYNDKKSLKKPVASCAEGEQRLVPVGKQTVVENIIFQWCQLTILAIDYWSLIKYSCSYKFLTKLKLIALTITSYNKILWTHNDKKQNQKSKQSKKMLICDYKWAVILVPLEVHPSGWNIHLYFEKPSWTQVMFISKLWLKYD